MTATAVQDIEGQRTLVIENASGLPKAMPELLRQMGALGFTFSEDFPLRGTRTACEQLREHRFRRFREGRWFSRQTIRVYGSAQSYRDIPPGVLSLALMMCEDCGAVCVRDVSPEMWAGARPARLVNLRTGDERIAPAVMSRDVVLGWYSGARRAGRTHL
jgi:hypothetical protein